MLPVESERGRFFLEPGARPARGRSPRRTSATTDRVKTGERDVPILTTDRFDDSDAGAIARVPRGGSRWRERCSSAGAMNESGLVRLSVAWVPSRRRDAEWWRYRIFLLSTITNRRDCLFSNAPSSPRQEKEIVDGVKGRARPEAAPLQPSDRDEQADPGRARRLDQRRFGEREAVVLQLGRAEDQRR